MSRNRTIHIVSCYSKESADRNRYLVNPKSFRTLRKANQYAIKMAMDETLDRINLYSLKTTPSQVHISVSVLKTHFF